MKLPFRSRARVEDFDFDDLEDVGYDDLDVRRYGPETDGDPEQDALDQEALDLDLAGDLATIDGDTDLLTATDNVEDRGNDTGGDVEGAVSADEFSDQMERLRSEASAEQRTAWAYLGVLTGVFLLLVLFGYVLSDVRGPEAPLGPSGESVSALQPTQLVFRVDGDVIRLEGSLPDEASKAQLLATVQERYGAENVVDDLVVDQGFSFEDGTIRMIGSVLLGDERPQSVLDAVVGDFGLANRGFEISFVETVLSPVDALVQLADGRVELSGALPDQQSIDDLLGLAASVWGPTNVDGALLTVGETRWTDGRIRLAGTTVTGDQRITAFVSGVPERIDATVAVDTSGLVVNDISQLVDEIQTEINALVAASPISFAPLEAIIEPASDSVLAQVAALLGQIVDTPFEVVGHTDAVGDDQDNLVLSQDRAKAVVDRLAALGVAPERMSSRGEGENKPIGDNATEEGKAANRRIEFVLVGTSEGE